MKTTQKTIIELNQEELKTFNSANLLLDRITDNLVKNDCEDLKFGNAKIDIASWFYVVEIMKMFTESKIEIC